MFNCHINVEIATSIQSVKYLYKYIYKGHDRAPISVQSEDETVDEVKDHLDARYVSASESCWRIFEFNMHQNTPSVEQLPIHIEGGQSIPYDPATETAAEVISRPDIDTTKLTSFFDACVAFPDLTAGLLYPTAPPNSCGKPKTKSGLPDREAIQLEGYCFVLLQLGNNITFACFSILFLLPHPGIMTMNDQL
jgi:hypothetical protein